MIYYTYILCLTSYVAGTHDLADIFYHRLANVTSQLPISLKQHMGFNENSSYPLIELQNIVADARQTDLSSLDPENYYFANWSLSTKERIAHKIGVAEEVDPTLGRLVEYMLVYQYNYDWLEYKVLSHAIGRFVEEIEQEDIKCEKKHIADCMVPNQNEVRHLTFAADLHQLIYDSIDVISAETFMSIYELANDIYANSELLRNNIPNMSTQFLDIYKEAFLVLEEEVDKIILGESQTE